ncbi:MAG: HEAT repeat domain-containing protein, partial [Acidobacteria bacterium]|nr:HEAT repeat domain-containing protein [Acidobacteriota bacterium]
YRTPSRALNTELEAEPRFTVTDEKGRPVPDPAPRPCGGAKGTAVYGSVTLPPGQTHTERWLLDQWARFPGPGRYHVLAERRLPLLTVDPRTQEFAEPPAAYALAINELTLEIVPSTPSQLEAAYRPYLEELEKPKPTNLAEAVLVVTVLPQPFCLKELIKLAIASTQERRWDRQQALEGLARLGTPAAWEAISKIARGENPAVTSAGGPAASRPSTDGLRAYAVLLLGQQGDREFIPTLLGIASTTPDPALRGDVLRALGFFNDPQANQVLFDNLRSPEVSDRVNAILGLKNLESANAVPALLAMLKDPEAQARQVAHFALQSLTGQPFKLPPNASRADSARAAEEWHAWWRNREGKFVPVRHPPCRDW